MAAAADDHAELRIWRHVRLQLPVGDAPSNRAIDLLRRRAIFLHRPLSADPRRHRKSVADAQCHPRLLAAGEGLRLYVDLYRPVDAPDPDHGHFDHQLSDPERARRAAFPVLRRRLALPVSIPRHSTSGRTRTPSLACWRCNVRSTASTGNCPISPATTICTSCPTRPATSLLNGIASDISRQAYTNGVQGDAPYALNSAHTLREGFTVSAEETWGRQYVVGGDADAAGATGSEAA